MTAASASYFLQLPAEGWSTLRTRCGQKRFENALKEFMASRVGVTGLIAPQRSAFGSRSKAYCGVFVQCRTALENKGLQSVSTL